MKIRNMFYRYGVPASLVLSGSAFADGAGTLDPATVAAVKSNVLADTATASGAGFAVMAVVLSLTIGFGLLQTFVRKGAKG